MGLKKMKKIFKLMLHALEPINPKSIFLANFDDIKKNSGKLKKLNSEEREMLTEYVMETEIKKINGAHEDASYGVTVGKAIEMQREIVG